MAESTRKRLGKFRVKDILLNHEGNSDVYFLKGMQESNYCQMIRMLNAYRGAVKVGESLPENRNYSAFYQVGDCAVGISIWPGIIGNLQLAVYNQDESKRESTTRSLDTALSGKEVRPK